MFMLSPVGSSNPAPQATPNLFFIVCPLTVRNFATSRTSSQRLVALVAKKLEIARTNCTLRQ